MSTTNPPAPHDTGVVPAWHDVRRFWLVLMEVYSQDCARAGVDNLDFKDLRYERGHVAHFMHELINARTAAERERIIEEAAQFLADQERRARLEPPAPPMRTVDVSQRPMLTTQPVRRPLLAGR